MATTSPKRALGRGSWPTVLRRGWRATFLITALVLIVVVLVVGWVARGSNAMGPDATAFVVDSAKARLQSRVQEYCNDADQYQAPPTLGVLPTGHELAAHMHGQLELRYVHTFARHGTRTTVHTVNNVNDAGPCTPAHLTLEELRRFQVHQYPRPQFEGRVKQAHEALEREGRVPHKHEVDAMTLHLQFDNVVGDKATAWPTDVHEGCRPGLLTAAGVEQHRAIGKALRQAYIDRLGFLPPTLREAAPHMHIESTDYSRTILSAASNVQGMFPNHTWNLEQPFQLHVPARAVDEALFVAQRFTRVQCPIREPVILQTKDDVAHRRNAALADFMAELASVDRREVPSPAHIADMMYARACRGEPLPCWDSECLPPRIAAALLSEADWEYSVRFFNRSTAQTAVPLLHRFMDGAWSYLTTGAGPKWRFSTMHDITLAPVLSALGAYDGRWPPLASTIVFEVWAPPADVPQAQPGSLPDHARVRVIYNGLDVTHRLNCYDAAAPAELCTWKRFVHSVTPMETWHQQCDGA